MSAIGTKRTSSSALHMSAFGGNADTVIAVRNVRFLTQSGHYPVILERTYEILSSTVRLTGAQGALRYCQRWGSPSHSLPM